MTRDLGTEEWEQVDVKDITDLVGFRRGDRVSLCYILACLLLPPMLEDGRHPGYLTMVMEPGL